ncbi:MAG: hypothetical protein N3A55_06605 [Methylohalobius sp.]|nr:hypothetical protein [Methylohalobius sp.]
MHQYSQSKPLEELRKWFQHRLEQDKVWFDPNRLSYDGNTPYDLLCYRLQAEAARYWRETYGFEPTPGQLSQAFFMAEYERFQAVHPKLYRTWRKLKCWFGFLLLASRGHL